MKTTLEIPDELMKSIKLRAVREDKKLKDLVAELLERGLAAEARTPAQRHRVTLPLIHSTHPAAPGEELTPDRVADILLDQEVEWSSGRR